MYKKEIFPLFVGKYKKENRNSKPISEKEIILSMHTPLYHTCMSEQLIEDRRSRQSTYSYEFNDQFVWLYNSSNCAAPVTGSIY